MAQALGDDELARYRRDGFVFPVDVLTETETRAAREKLESYERQAGGPLKGAMRHKPHLLFPWINELARHPRILDAVESLLGPDLLIWGSTFFIKEANDPSFAARLVVGADGRASPSRKAAGIVTTTRGFGQTALTLSLRHARDHDDVSTEFHTREGPFTLVPLPPAPDAPHRSSLVWLMRDATFARIGALDDTALLGEIRRRAHGFLGEMEIKGARGAFPMNVQRVSRLTGRRLALIGDAAHAFPPIGAQGLNLGLRDAQTLIAEASAAADPGGEIMLGAYAAARRPDILTRTLGVGLLNMSLLAGFGPIDAARGLGLSALGAFRPLRRLAMREGLNPFLAR